MTLRKTFASAAFALAIATILVPAVQAADADAHSIRVAYTEADLVRHDRAAALYQRIRVAAERVCPTVDGVTLDRKRKFIACRVAAIDEAVSSLGSPVLTAIHQRRDGTSFAWATR